MSKASTFVAPTQIAQANRAPAQANSRAACSLDTVTCQSGLDNFINSRGGLSILRIDGIIYGRLTLLQQAISVPQDLFFLALHQILCLALVRPAQLPPAVLESQKLGPAIKILISVLGGITVPGFGFLEYFSDFPIPIHTALQQFPNYLVAFNQIGRALEHIVNNFTKFEADCIEFKKPPMIWELVKYLGINSPILQRVICTAIVRRTFNIISSTNKLLLELEPVYRDYQTEYIKLAQTTGNMETQIAIRYLGQHAVHRKYLQKLKKIYHTHLNPGRPQDNETQPSRPAPRSVSHIQTASPGSVVQAGNWMQQNAAPSLEPSTHTPINNMAAGFFLATAVQPPDAARPLLPPVWSINANGYAMPDQYPWMLGPSQRPTRPLQPAHLPSTPVQGKGPEPDRTLFFARPGVAGPQVTPAEPLTYALHQVNLQSPVLKTTRMASELSERQPMYQFVAGLAMQATRLDVVKKIQQWHFDISEADFSQIPIDTKSSEGLATTRTITRNSQIYRLRCVKPKIQADDISKIKEWLIGDTYWPRNVYFNCNGTRLQPRRKLLHGKDLAIDITPYIRAGVNTIKAMSNQPKDTPDANCAIAVEVVRAEYRDQIRAAALICTIPAADTEKALCNSLTVRHASASAHPNDKDDDDDEITITNNTLTVLLTDPFFGGTIWNTPCRSIHCLHRECFDLDNYLDTRRRRTPDAPTEVDVWVCPICQVDARPVCLVVDGWMVEVKRTLEGNGREGVKAVVVGVDGKWVPREEKRFEGVNLIGKREEGKGGAFVGKMVGEVCVVELDDDD